MRPENRVKWSGIRRGDLYAKYEASQCLKTPFGEIIDGTLVSPKEVWWSNIGVAEAAPGLLSKKKLVLVDRNDVEIIFKPVHAFELDDRHSRSVGPIGTLDQWFVALKVQVDRLVGTGVVSMDETVVDLKVV